MTIYSWMNVSELVSACVVVPLVSHLFLLGGWSFGRRRATASPELGPRDTQRAKHGSSHKAQLLVLEVVVVARLNFRPGQDTHQADQSHSARWQRDSRTSHELRFPNMPHIQNTKQFFVPTFFQQKNTRLHLELKWP